MASKPAPVPIRPLVRRTTTTTPRPPSTVRPLTVPGALPGGLSRDNFTAPAAAPVDDTRGGTLRATGKRKPRSLWQQVWDQPMTLSRGVADLAWSGVRTAAMPATMLAGLAVKDDDESWGDYAFRQAPLVTQVAPGLIHQVKDVARTLYEPGYGAEVYSQASREGRLVDRIVGDAGTVALVAGGAAGLLGKAPIATTVTAGE